MVGIIDGDDDDYDADGDDDVFDDVLVMVVMVMLLMMMMTRPTFSQCNRLWPVLHMAQAVNPHSKLLTSYDQLGYTILRWSWPKGVVLVTSPDGLGSFLRLRLSFLLSPPSPSTTAL